MMNSNNSRYVVNIWQAVPHANFAVLTVDLCPENDDGVDRQPSPAQPSPAQPSPAQPSTSKLHFQNSQLFKKVLRQFKMRSTAEWFTVIVICTVEEQAKILESMNKELNLPSELCFWIDGNHSSTKKDVNKGHKSVVRGIVVGYNHSTASEPVKASWQEAVGVNAFHCPSVKRRRSLEEEEEDPEEEQSADEDTFILDANQEPVSSISMIKFNRISLL